MTSEYYIQNTKIALSVWKTSDLTPGDLILTPDGNMILVLEPMYVCPQPTDSCEPLNYFDCLVFIGGQSRRLNKVAMSERLSMGHELIKL